MDQPANNSAGNDDAGLLGLSRLIARFYDRCFDSRKSTHDDITLDFEKL